MAVLAITLRPKNENGEVMSPYAVEYCDVGNYTYNVLVFGVDEYDVRQFCTKNFGWDKYMTVTGVDE